MASIDRQALLEQKRKRLQELKERRSGVSLVDPTQPNLAIGNTEAVRTKVDFAVQVDLIHPPSVSSTQNLRNDGQIITAPIKNNDEASVRSSVKFDKIVQTHFERLRDPEPAPNHHGNGTAAQTIDSQDAAPVQSEPHAETMSALGTEQKVESSLHEFLHESGFHFSNLRLGIKHEKPTNSDLVAPFNVTKSVSNFINRPVIAVASTPEYPGVFLAAYGKPNPSLRSKKHLVTASVGLAVLFNSSSGTVVPEFFLQCTSPIQTIMFDKTNSFKVFAGLENGRVVMWDLSDVKPTQVAVLPTLQTSTVASVAVKAQHKFIHHISPILLMAQLNTESSQSSGVLTICADGVVNLWSPNFLAFPKIPSLRLTDDEHGVRIPFRLTDGLIVSTMFRVSEQASHQNPPEYNFLNSTILASKNGNIYKLANLKEKAFIRSKLVDASQLEGPSARSVNSVVELNYNATTKFLLSAHSDWSLKLWDLESCKLRHVSPTTTVVDAIIPRPGHGSQFITISKLRPPHSGLFVEFWDIKAKLLSPISTIPTREKKSGTALFNADGSEMILAYDDGEMDVFEIEESLLTSQIKSQSYVSVDDGVEKLLSSL
ncbi:hypothetical protein JCM33374_g4686 [Metschnikowia sp. JCM 33374]|nr:hypothetical protein JCM33374_g4686 [Metschnikowia sp. JCM 33374]